MISDKTTKTVHWQDSNPNPFQTLHLDILSYIFELTLRDPMKESFQATRHRSSAPGSELTSVFSNRAYREAYALHSRESPHTLGQICSHWRNVALDTPKLWAGIHVGEDPVEGTCGYCPETEGEQKLIQCLRTYLARSKNEPFSLTMAFRCHRCCTWDQMPLLDEILGNLQRFRLLDFCIGFKQAVQIVPLLFDRIAREGSRLEEFSISTDRCWGKYQLPQLDLGLSPLLKHLFVNRFMVQMTLPDQAGTPFHRLKCLDMGAHYPPEQLLYWISLLPALESVSVQELKPKYDLGLLPEGYEIVTSHSLKTLVIPKSLCQKDPDDCLAFMYFLSHLCAPGLESLRIGGRDHGSARSSEFPMGSAESEICDFIRRSCPPLKELVMGADLSKEALLGLLLGLPAIERLELHERLASDEVVSALIGSSTSPSLCPELKAIWLLRCDSEDLSPSMIIKLMESRCDRFPGSREIEEAMTANHITEDDHCHVEEEERDRWFKNIKLGLLKKLHIRRSRHYQSESASLSVDNSQPTSVTPVSVGEGVDRANFSVGGLKSISVWGGKVLDYPKSLEDLKTSILSSYDLDYFELSPQGRQQRMYPKPIEDDQSDEE